AYTDQGKTATAVILQKTVKNEYVVVEFGKAAVRRIGSLSGTNRQRYIYLHNFKMQLYVANENKTIGRKTVVKDEETGVEVPAVDAIAACLKHVKNEALKQLKQAQTVVCGDILWVVTIPAIWTIDAKQLMKNAAIKAGLTTTDRLDRLHLALEPEAASMWCLSDSKYGLRTGTVYIVADCGGGTVDVTVHKVTGSVTSSVKEVKACSGGNWGSTAIDRKFYATFEEIIGTEALNDLKLDDADEWRDVQHRWEESKCAFDGVTDVSIKVPSSVRRVLASGCKVFNDKHKTGFEKAGNCLNIPAADVLKIFEPSVEKTVEHLQSIVWATPEATKIILVGNFSNSIVLRDAFEKAFSSSQFSVIVPNLAGECVMLGAVLIGNNPLQVAERISNYSYGISVCRCFDADIHLPISKKLIDGIEYAMNVADWFVQYGEVVKSGRVVKKGGYGSIKEGQQRLNFTVYEGRVPGIEYIESTNPNVRELGNIVSEDMDPEILKAQRYYILSQGIVLNTFKTIAWLLSSNLKLAVS
ncbi:hypothetical protein BDR26DRAFT_962234, partial [Obelidium mucronatum]